MHKSTGFTLIELVFVIVILSFLSAIAVPKFISLNRNMKIAVIKSASESMRTTVKMLHLDAQINNSLGIDKNVETQFGLYLFTSGYPTNKSESTDPNLYFIETFMDFGGMTNEIKNNIQRTATYGRLNSYEDDLQSIIGYGTNTIVSDLCYAEYVHVGASHEVSIHIDGC